MSSELPPHAAEHAGPFVDSAEPTLALVGEVLHVTDQSGITTYHLLRGQDLTLKIDEDLLPLFEFFATPRSESQSKEWLAWSDAPAGFLDDLIRSGFLVKVDCRTPITSAKSLKGLKLVPQSLPGERASNGYVYVMLKESDQPVLSVSPELAMVLWGNDREYDIPKAVKAVSKTSSERMEETARRVLTVVPMLLESGYARLEWLRVPSS